MSISEVASYYSMRIVSSAIAIWLGYYLVTNYIEPDIFEPICLTDTDSCSSVELYLYKNTFLGKEKISQVWFWYNGSFLYVYGIANGKCDDKYQPVNVFSLKVVDDVIRFTRYPNQCITSITFVEDYYKGVSELKNYYIKKSDFNGMDNIFNIINDMYDNKIFVLS